MYQPPFELSDEMVCLVAEISESIGNLNTMMADNLPHPTLRKQNRIKTIQSSLAIENNTLSIEQVTAIIEGKRILSMKQGVGGQVAWVCLETKVACI